MIVSAKELASRRERAQGGTDLQWPRDYTSLDQGRLSLCRGYEESFKMLGWTTCEAVMTSTKLQVVRNIEQRDNCKVDLPMPQGGTTRAYLKRHWTPVVDLAGVSEKAFAPGMMEAEAVGRCQQAGVGTMTVLAVGHRTVGNVVESFFLSKELDQAYPADDFWIDRMGRPEEKRSSDEDRRNLLTCMAQAARRFHDADLFHRDFYWCHFFVAEPAPGNFDVHLIDLQRVLTSRRFRLRWLLKDLAQFRFSCPAGYLSDSEIDFWFDQYFQTSQRSLRRAVAQRIIQWRAKLYQWRERRR